MQSRPLFFPSVVVAFTGQSLVSHAGVRFSPASWMPWDSLRCVRTGRAGSFLRARSSTVPPVGGILASIGGSTGG